MREVGPRPTSARKVVAVLRGLQLGLGDGLLVEQEQSLHELAAEDAGALAKGKIAPFVEVFPTSARGHAQLDADHRDMQALAGFIHDCVFGLASQGRYGLPLESAELLDDRLLGQSPRRQVRHAHVQPEFAPGSLGHGAAPFARLSISRASASILQSLPTISISSMRTPNWRSMPVRSSVELSEST